MKRHLRILATGLTASFLAAASGGDISPDADQPTSDRRTAATEQRVTRLVAKHDCWTGEAPEGVIPERAVVSLPRKQPAVVKSDVGFDIWLGPDSTPNSGDERPGTVHAFCP